MSEDILLVERKAPAIVLTLNRPAARNALSSQLLARLRAALLEAEQDPEIRGIVLTGNEKYFSAGADLKEAMENHTPLEIGRWLDHFTDLNRTIERLSKPVIAAINGHCMTGALEVALACDIRLAGSGAQFAITSARIGTVAGAGGTQRLPRMVGIQRAKDILMGAEVFGANAAKEYGIVLDVFAPDEVVDKALERVSVYAERAPLSVWFAKKAVHVGTQMDLEDAIEFEQSMVAHLYSTEDRIEGISAFLEKRSATFKGK
ncbi:MAG: enoyl-CoA hydratase/isomerase family protein [Hyphomicrobiaceae bacterium]